MFQKMKKMVHRMKIKDVVTLEQLSDVASTFFNVLTDENTYPLVKDFITSDNVENINWDYFGSHSADKYISPIYLLTDHIGFYERYGWEFLGMVQRRRRT